jgi:uncharacterized protein (DUF2236 family)
MTDSPYAADAAGLVERSATAFIGAVPEQPADDGYFGPASVTWRVAGDLSGPVAGLRALLMQALHPLAMAGVDQHSDWRRDRVGRLAPTSAYLATVTFGDRAAADAAAARVRRVHEHVRGTVTGTGDGEAYSASDPTLLLWVHATFVDSGLAGCRLFGNTAFGTPADADAYVREMAISAALLGVPEELIPSDAASLASFITTLVPRLRLTPAARESASYLLDPPGMDDEIADLWQEIRDAVLISLPSWALSLYGLPAMGPLSGDRRTEIRGALGVLDAVFMGEPGVLEARQRITLRMRAA